MAAEEKFGVKIPDDEVKNLKTVGDAVSYIERPTPPPDRPSLDDAEPEPATGIVTCTAEPAQHSTALEQGARP